LRKRSLARKPARSVQKEYAAKERAVFAVRASEMNDMVREDRRAACQRAVSGKTANLPWKTLSRQLRGIPGAASLLPKFAICRGGSTKRAQASEPRQIDKLARFLLWSAS
jgi:hypothetical protein